MCIGPSALEHRFEPGRSPHPGSHLQGDTCFAQATPTLFLPKITEPLRVASGRATKVSHMRSSLYWNATILRSIQDGEHQERIDGGDQGNYLSVDRVVTLFLQFLGAFYRSLLQKMRSWNHLSELTP